MDKSCPFCRNPVDAYAVTNGDSGGNTLFIKCKTKDCAIFNIPCFADKWNTRVLKSFLEQEELSEEIRKIIEYYKLVGSKYELHDHIAFTILDLEAKGK